MVGAVNPEMAGRDGNRDSLLGYTHTFSFASANAEHENGGQRRESKGGGKKEDGVCIKLTEATSKL